MANCFEVDRSKVCSLLSTLPEGSYFYCVFSSMSDGVSMCSLLGRGVVCVNAGDIASVNTERGRNG